MGCSPSAVPGLCSASGGRPPGCATTGRLRTQAPAQFLSPQQLDTLVAPVALYPDALLSQVLVASTYPLEIAEAAQWLQQKRQSSGPPTGGRRAPTELGPQYSGFGGLPGRGQPAELRHPLDHRSWQRLPRATGGRNECRTAHARPSQAAGKLRSNAAADGHDRDAGRSIGHRHSTGQSRGGLCAFLQSPVHLGTARLRLLPAVGLRGHRLWIWIWIWPWHLHWRLFRRPGMGRLGLGTELVPSLDLSESLFFNRFGFGGRGFGAGATWAHDPAHRLGVPYSNSALSRRYGGLRPRAVDPVPGDWAHNHIRRSGKIRLPGPMQRKPAVGVVSARRAPPPGGVRLEAADTARVRRTVAATAHNRAAPSYRSSPSYGGSSAYRASPYYGRSYGGNRSVPNYRSSPSYGGGYHSRSSYSGGSSHVGGGSVHSGGGSSHGGGGGFHGGGGRR